MSPSSREEPVFSLSGVLKCGDIQLSTWCQNGRTQLLALYLSRGDIVICLLTGTQPIIRRVPWFKDAVHRPVALAFSPAGSFLLVLSESCHLYTVPALTILDHSFKTDTALNSTDVTMFSYPFKKTPESRRASSSSNCGESSLETAKKLKDLAGKRAEKVGRAVSWYQTLEECQHIGVVGTLGGDIIFVDLVSGVQLANTSIRGDVTALTVCVDNSLDSVFLLISSTGQQYRLNLEQRTGWGSPNTSKGRSRGGSSEEGEEEPPKNYRARLHGFKQMSVEKLASIKLKIAETRARAHLKPVADESGVKPLLTSLPEPLDVALRDTSVSLQYSRGRYVMSGYHPPSQLLTVHSTSMEVNPLFVYKMPGQTAECLLSDRIVYVVSEDRTQVIAVSSHLSESRIERDSEFNPECVLGKFDITSSSIQTKSGELSPPETIIGIYKACGTNSQVQVPKEWQVDGINKLVEESGGEESCLVVTTNEVLRLGLTDNIVYITLRLILDNHALIQAERLCKIFGLNLSKVLELAGDIDLARLKFPSAIARYKLANCGPLRITVKLARLGHCSELLSYSTALLTSANSNLSLTDHIHISNLLLMSFVHQILQNGAAHLMRKFLVFLETNDYYDKGLGMNVTAQSLLFSAVHRLITHRGLIADGLAVTANLINNFNHDPHLFSAAEDDEMWLCFSEPGLQEAFVFRPQLFEVWCEFIARHLHQLSPVVLDRLCRVLDPSSPSLRPLTRLPPPEDEHSFPLQKLVQLFLTTLLVRVSKDRLEYNKCLMLPDEEPNYANLEGSPPREAEEVMAQHIWAIRKERKGSMAELREGRIISCGFGHTALIRNGTVMTWGLSTKGSLGHGVTLARYAPPESISWFGSFRLQVSHVSCGRAHIVALTNNGVYAWGSSQFGQLGLGSLQESPHPRLVESLSRHRVVSAVCGQYHTLCLTSSGSVLAFGWNVHGQLGLGNIENVRMPVLVHALREHVIVEVAGGHGHSLVLTDTGHVYSFGSSIFGQLGSGSVYKSSLPILVKGISGKVTKIATGYFHNLALVASNALYAWGASPQVLRLQGQAHKRARALHLISAGGEDLAAEAASSEAHLKPVKIDTRNVSGKIVQIACGCHHFALMTENGSLYTWGRSMDGQLGNGSRSEVVLPSLVQDGSLKVSALALGCDFSVVVEKHSGKVFAWGSNGFGQVGIPIKDSAAKASDGKIIVVKTVKRVVRLPNSVANLVDSPVEVPGIPSATFTYQPLNSVSATPTPATPNNYTSATWHRTLQTFLSVINPDLLLCKCLELENHQAASKLLLLQGQIRQALVHQLKALQRAQKQRGKNAEVDEVKERKPDKTTRVVQTPDVEIHPFTVQGGVEGMCDMADNVSRNGLEGGLQSSPAHNLDLSMAEYTTTALEILLRFLLHAPDSASDILETGVQFWTAHKLPMAALETFLKEHMDRVFYPLGSLLYLGKGNLGRHFSAELQLRVTSRLVAHVEQNGSCEEFLAVLSSLLSLDGKSSVADLSAKLQNPRNKNIHVTWPQCPGDDVYIFSCGHSTNKIVVPSGLDKLAEAYAKLDTGETVDMACPDCVCTIIPNEVAFATN